MAIELEISDTQKFISINSEAIRGLVTRTLNRESRSDARVEISFVDNSTIHAINRSHLGHDWPTDVITFPLTDPDAPILEGELLISTEMAKLEAADRGLDAQTELFLYIIHGLLHLCGFDDTTPDLAEHMRAREAYHLAAEIPNHPGEH
jgi:probable rRNA maturation factor